MYKFDAATATRLQRGGFLEASVMCKRWNTHAHVFQKRGGDFVAHIISLGKKTEKKPSCILAFDGIHFNCLVLKQAALNKLQADLAGA